MFPTLKETNITYDEQGNIAKIDIWHPCEGKWHRITQTFGPNNDNKYYTDGNEVWVPLIDTYGYEGED